MNAFKLFLLLTILTSVIYVAESFFILGGLLLIKAALIKGLIVGSILGAASSRDRYRYRREASEADIEPMLASASQRDVDDCAKKLICSLSSKDVTTLADDEALILSLFGIGDLDVSKPTVEFDLAATMGRKAGAGRCHEVYARCPYNELELMKIMRDPSTGNLV